MPSFENLTAELSGRSVIVSWQFTEITGGLFPSPTLYPSPTLFPSAPGLHPVAPTDWDATNITIALTAASGYSDVQSFTIAEFLALATVAGDESVTVVYTLPDSAPAMPGSTTAVVVTIVTAGPDYVGNAVVTGEIGGDTPDSPPTALRWRTAQLQASVKDYLLLGLTDLGWITTQPSWLTSPVSVEEDWDAEKILLGADPPVPNTIGISTGELGDALAAELGASTPGGLVCYSTPIFLDVYGENRSVSLRLADDLRDILLGQQFRASRYLPIYDHSTEPATLVSGEQCEMRLVQASWPQGVGEQDWRRAWRVVKVTALWYFSSLALEAPGP